MRLRGAKQELADAGEDTEGMANSVSTLRQQLIDLAGVDIQLDDSTFKSTYQILDELSQKWDERSDIDQAAITELVAGKRQGNVISSLMSNFDTAREALEASQGSEGSATTEHEKWLESMEAKTNQFKAQFQELSVAIMDSDFLKGLIDSGTTFLGILTDIVDTLGMIPTLGMAIGTALTFKNSGELSNQFQFRIILRIEYARKIPNGNMNETACILVAQSRGS